MNNYNRGKIWIFSCTIFSISIMIILFFAAKVNEIETNGFDRNIKFELLKPDTIELKAPGYYFAGEDSAYIYLGNRKLPIELLKLGKKDKETKVVLLKSLDDIILNWDAAKLDIDSPNIYLLEGIKPMFIRGTLGDGNMNKVDRTIPYFITGSVYSGTSLVFKVNSRKYNQIILRNFSIDTPHTMKGEYILERQMDGVFSVDGSLKYESETNRYFYVYTYRNLFTCLDSNLNILFNEHTIDTNSVAKIKVAQITDKKTVLASPPRIVNFNTTISNGYLFIQSQLRADNDDYISLDKNAAIDMYETKNGKYFGSFYIPLLNGEEKFANYHINKEKFYGIYGNKLVISDIVKK